MKGRGHKALPDSPNQVFYPTIILRTDPEDVFDDQ